VVYSHCNSGSRRDAEEAVFLLIPLGISVFTVDFAVSPLLPNFTLCMHPHSVHQVRLLLHASPADLQFRMEVEL
jgi:hypothetical protein